MNGMESFSAGLHAPKLWIRTTRLWIQCMTTGRSKKIIGIEGIPMIHISTKKQKTHDEVEDIIPGLSRFQAINGQSVLVFRSYCVQRWFQCKSQMARLKAQLIKRHIF